MNSFFLKIIRGGYNIVEVVDKVLSRDKNAAGLAINWQLFGTNEQEKADYSRGVLERFTRRASKGWSAKTPEGNLGGNVHVKTLANPRAINFYCGPHFPIYFSGLYSVNENGRIVRNFNNDPVTAEKIVINHYFTKSREEFFNRRKQVRGDTLRPYDNVEAWFNTYNRNEEFDDGILRYRDARAKIYQPPKPRSDEVLIKALKRNLLPIFKDETPPEFYVGKMETFLTCRAVAAYLQTRLPEAKFYETASLNAVLKSLDRLSMAENYILIRELPNLLSLPYPVVRDLREEVSKRIPLIIESLNLARAFGEVAWLNIVHSLLKLA